MGLYPNAQVVLSKRSPFDGPLLIEVEQEPHALAHGLARMLIVTPIA
jgi:Fe2+ transport system protein FeoA